VRIIIPRPRSVRGKGGEKISRKREEKERKRWEKRAQMESKNLKNEQWEIRILNAIIVGSRVKKNRGKEKGTYMGKRRTHSCVPRCRSTIFGETRENQTPLKGGGLM